MGGDSLGWSPGVIAAACKGGTYLLPGWVRHPFCLDWGIVETDEDVSPVWVIHHLPTGYNMMATTESVGEAIKIVDLLLTMGDWDFTEPSGVFPYAGALSMVRDAGFTVLRPSGIKRPDYPDQITTSTS